MNINKTFLGLILWVKVKMFALILYCKMLPHSCALRYVITREIGAAILSKLLISCSIE